MIQRVQTLFLLLASAAAFLLFNFKIWSAKIQFFIYEASLMDFSVWDNFWLKVLAIAIGIISFLNIFLYKKRKIQLWIGWLNIFLTIGFVGAAYYISKQLELAEVQKMVILTFHFGTYLPPIIVVLTLLANFFIYRDEKLIRSMERLR